jgi:hypothetical protein
MIPIEDLPCAPGLTDLIPFPDKIITDTELSFRNAIARYSLLEQAASSLLIDLPALTPNQLLLRSSQLAQMQQDLTPMNGISAFRRSFSCKKNKKMICKALTRQDDQLIAILTLAGPEILTNPFIKAYRHILAQVSLIFTQIREQTATIKKNIPTDSTSRRNLDSSCQD